MKTVFTWLGLCLSLVLITAPLGAQQTESELAKKTQNPVADLISVPFQNNFNFGAGTKDQTIYILNVQPVIPIRLTEDCESHHADNRPHNQPAVAVPGNRQRLWARGHQPDVLSVAELNLKQTN